MVDVPARSLVWKVESALALRKDVEACWSGVIGNASDLYSLECGIVPHLQLQMEKYPMLAKGIDC